jgi:hypothetical protein
LKVKARASIIFNGQPHHVVRGVSLPQSFITYFLIPDDLEIGKAWNLELQIQIQERGTPQVVAICPSALASEKSGFVDYEPISGISSHHISYIYKNYKNLISLSCELAVSEQVRNLKPEAITSYRREVTDRISKRRLTPEFLTQVQLKKETLQKQFKDEGVRDTSNKALAELYKVEVKTVEAWIAKPLTPTKKGKK